MNSILVSVIIPTYNDWTRLSMCLNALSNQTYPPELFEIIVINNKVDSDPEDLKVPSNCKIINEFKPGSYAARNAGVKIAEGKILAFTDSDCIPDKEWLNNAVNYMNNNPSVGRVAGNINLFYKSAKLTPVELYEKIYAFDQELYVTRDCTAVTANMFTYKYIFEKVGLFNDNLMSGGDNEWSLRAQKGGFGIKYVKEVIVNHPARHLINELISKAKRVGGGQAMSLANKKSAPKKVMSLVYDLRPPVKSIKLINKRGEGLDIKQKTTVFLLRYYLSIVTAFEKYQVQSGKNPRHL